MEPRNRRAMLKSLGLVTGGYMATQRGYAANETIRIGCIGTGGRSQALMRALVKIPGAKIVTVCDVWDQALVNAQKITGNQANFTPTASPIFRMYSRPSS